MVIKNSKNIDICQISGKKDLKKVLSLGYLPAVNNYFSSNLRKNEESFFPAEIFYSRSSKLMQLGTIVNKNIIFPKHYPYTSSTTKILRENFKELYSECKKILDLKKKDLVVDIGSNDGNLLSNFKGNHKVLGVTPEQIGKIAIKRGIKTIIKYFDNSTCNIILKKYGKAKLITATNVFAHIDNVEQLMKNINKIIKKDGVFITESHYLVSLIKTVQYDTIYHEHLRYYSLTSLNYLFEKYNFKVFHAKEINSHGGSIRVYVSKNKKFKVRESVKKILQREKKFLTWNTFKKFKKNVIKSKIKLYSLIKKIKDEKKNNFWCWRSFKSCYFN